jgi:hypothetical protein
MKSIDDQLSDQGGYQNNGDRPAKKQNNKRRGKRRE